MIDLTSARVGLERLYTDVCTISEYQSVKDPDTHITNKQLVVVTENVPCRLSHKTLQATGDGAAPSVSMVTKLIIAPEIAINAGSKISITRNGVTTVYKQSGEPARYTNHQEIMLELEEDYA